MLPIEVEHALHDLRPRVDRHITRDRVRRYFAALADTPAPSTAAAVMRGPVLRQMLQGDGAFAGGRLHWHADFRGTGSAVLLTGTPEPAKPLWYFAHLDTISYLVQPSDSKHYPLIPFCFHMIAEGSRAARAYRYDFARKAYVAVADGQLVSVAHVPSFEPLPGALPLRAGDRVVPVVPFNEPDGDGGVIAHVDNAGGVAALALAACVLAEANIEAMLAFPDEEEGPRGAGNQMMGRGGSRIVNQLPPPDLAVVADVQQAGGDRHADTGGGIENSTRLGAGAVLAEFSSLARGAVTPPHLYEMARYVSAHLAALGVTLQESNNAYSSRSDDVGVMLRTPNILLLGFPGVNRHFDHGEPRAHLDDVVNLARTLAYMSVLQPWWAAERRIVFGGGT